MLLGEIAEHLVADVVHVRVVDVLEEVINTEFEARVGEKNPMGSVDHLTPYSVDDHRRSSVLHSELPNPLEVVEDIEQEDMYGLHRSFSLLEESYHDEIGNSTFCARYLEGGAVSGLAGYFEGSSNRGTIIGRLRRSLSGNLGTFDQD